MSNISPTENDTVCVNETTQLSNTMDVTINPNSKQTETSPNNQSRLSQQQNTYIQEYNNTDTGPFVVWLHSIQQNVGNLHPLKLGKLLHQHGNYNIHEIKRINRNKLELSFNLLDHANQFLKSPILDEHGLKAFIPKHKTSIQGVIRDVDTSITNQEIQDNIISTLPVLDVYRFSRRSITTEGQIQYLPTQTVKITFRGQTLPQYVFLYSVRFAVDKYQQPILQCKNCYKYGHPNKYCRNQTTCSKCGDKHHTTKCSSYTLKCINCSLAHVADSQRCPVYESQKRIKTKMTELNIPSHEAALIIKGKHTDYSAQLLDFPSITIPPQAPITTNSQT